MNRISIDIPVSRAVRKFLIFKYGAEFILNQNEWLGILVASILNKKKTYKYYLPDKSNKEAVHYYRIYLSYSQYEKLGIMITPEKIESIAKALEKIFREYIFEKAIMDKNLYNIPYKNTIINTLEFYGVEDSDGYYESIRRDFSRKKNKITQKCFHNCP